MGFQPGHKLSKGRPKGSANRRTLEVRELLAASGFCPTTALIEVHKIAMTRFVEEIQLVESGKYSPMESNAHTYLKIAADMAKDLASYVNPKLKSIEQVKPGALDEMTPVQKLEAMKQAVRILEIEAAGKEVPNGSRTP